MPVSLRQVRQRYVAYVRNAQRRVPYAKYSAAAKAPETDTIAAITSNTGLAPVTVKKILLQSGARTEKQLAKNANTAMKQHISMAGRLDPKTLSWIRTELAKKERTMREIAKKGGISLTALKKINKDEKIRTDSRSVGNKIQKAAQYKDAHEAARELLSEKTPEGQPRYTQEEVFQKLQSMRRPISRRIITRITRDVRPETREQKPSSTRVPRSARREEFLRKAHRLTFESRDRIIARQIDREAEIGYHTTREAMLLATTKVRKKHRIRGRRFAENNGDKKRILKTYWTEPSPRTFDWLKMAKKLKLPIYFIRQTIVQEFLRRGYHSSVISERTHIPEHEIRSLKPHPAPQVRQKAAS